MLAELIAVNRLRHRLEPKWRSWNIRIEVKPRPGECQLRFLWRDALVTMVCLGVPMLPFVLVSAPPDQGTSFRGDESLIEVAVWLLLFPFAAAAMILTVIKTLKAIALSPFV